MATITARVSTRTTAACSACDWTSERLTPEFPVRTAARHHVGATGHSVMLLTDTVTVLEQLGAAPSAVADPAWPQTRAVRPVGGPDSSTPAGILNGVRLGLNDLGRDPDLAQLLSIDRAGGTR